MVPFAFQGTRPADPSVAPAFGGGSFHLAAIPVICTEGRRFSNGICDPRLLWPHFREEGFPQPEASFSEDWKNQSEHTGPRGPIPDTEGPRCWAAQPSHDLTSDPSPCGLRFEALRQASVDSQPQPCSSSGSPAGSPRGSSGHLCLQ